MTVMYLAAKSAMDKTEPVRLHFKTAINMSVMYMISVYLTAVYLTAVSMTAVCMTSVYMTGMTVCTRHLIKVSRK